MFFIDIRRKHIRGVLLDNASVCSGGCVRRTQCPHNDIIEDVLRWRQEWTHAHDAVPFEREASDASAFTRVLGL